MAPPNQDVASFRKIVKPLLTLLMVSGIYFDKQSSTLSRRVVQLFYCVIMNLFHWSTAGRMVWCITNSNTLDANVLMNTAYAIFFVAIAVMLNVFTSVSPIRLPRVVDSIQKLHHKYGQPSYMKNVSSKLQRTILITAVCMAAVASGTFMVFVTSEEVKTQRLCLMTPFTDNDPVVFYTMMLVYLVAVAVLLVGFSGLLLAFGLTCYLLRKEFSANTERLRQVLSQNNMASCRDVERIRLQYEEIVDLVQTSNMLFSLCILGVYACIIPFYVLTMFSVTVETYTVIFTAQAVFNMAFVTGCVVALTLAGERVTSQAHVIHDVILKMDFSSLDDKVVKSLTVFLVRLTGSPVGFWAGGMFMVDSSAFLTIFGLVATYTVVIFQFQPTRAAAGANIMNTTVTM